MNNLTESEILSIREVYNNLYKGKFDVLNKLFEKEDFQKYKTKTLLKMAVDILKIEVNERNFYRWVNLQKTKYTNTPIQKDNDNRVNPTPINNDSNWSLVDPQNIQSKKEENTIKKVKSI